MKEEFEITLHAPNSPGVRLVLRRNPPCLRPTFGSATRRRLAGTWVGQVGVRFGRSWGVDGGEAKEEVRNREGRAASGRRRRRRGERMSGGESRVERKEQEENKSRENY